MKVDVNADMGESFGRYNLGNDEALMKYITSANVATSFHAGDPMVMEKTVALAKKYNVAVGAHVGLPDRQGFGRRMMDITKEELRSDTLYQLGALDGILKVYEMTMQHIKPHGILYRMVSENEKYIDTFLNTVKEYDPNL
ncbi:MAG: LamB/YcsF family protein, partial [Methanosarcina sp.]|nr:LamB/YcsF family protein [Methanosarcina sp.]